MGFDTIHETNIAEIVGIMKTGISVASDMFVKPRRSDIVYSGSLTKATKGLVMEFPVLVSKANNIESAGIVAKAYEAKFVTMLQLAFAACNLTTSQDGFEFLKDFHTNLDSKDMSVDSFIDTMNSIASSMHESGKLNADSYAQYKAVVEDMRNLSFYFDSDIKESSLNSYKVMDNYGKIKVVKEADDDYDWRADQLDMQWQKLQLDIQKYNDELPRKASQEERENRRLELQQRKQELENEKFKLDQQRYGDDVARKNAQELRDNQKLNLQIQGNDLANKKFELDKQKYGDDIVRKNAQELRDNEKLNLQRQQFDHSKNQDALKHDLDVAKFRQSAIQNQLLTTDVKKANELVPTMMIVNFIYLDKDTQAQVHRQIIIGVKAKLYEVEPVDVISRIITKHVDSNAMLKFIKVSTREISFVRDFLLAIDSAKLDALSKSKRGSANKLFKVLERRAVKGKIRQTLKMKDYSKAISSLVISQEEAEELLKNNIDVNDPRIIRPIMEKLNLISFAIIDESSESVKFLFDTGDDVYETIPLSKLEKEQKDGMSKKVINLMAKMNR